ncbi:gamma-type small acid-soluble spore protein [Niallia sp. 01092]|uniref:gamma-type small acid-soluble spore protein n=1 Tax=unclassified Niallia TaxID=2837522 RepID=UPI003FD595E2
MAKKAGATQTGTNIQEVKQKNAQSAGTAGAAGAAGQFGTEFAGETNAAEVKKLNQQAEAKKAQNSSK